MTRKEVIEWELQRILTALFFLGEKYHHEHDDLMAHQIMHAVGQIREACGIDCPKA